MLDWQYELLQKGADLKPIEMYLLVHPQELTDLIAGLSEANDDLRFQSFQICLNLIPHFPAEFFQSWDHFVRMLHSENNFQRSIAIQILARLSPFDDTGRFEAIAADYFALFHGGSIMTVRYLIQSCAEIYLAKPGMREQILVKILHLETYVNLPQERIDLAKSDVLLCLDRIISQVPDRQLLKNFAETALQASSGKTRKQAKAFLKEHFPA